MKLRRANLMFGTRDPSAVSEADFPRDGLVRDWLRFAVRYAVLAPSSHNSQPWLFHFDGATLELNCTPTALARCRSRTRTTANWS